MKSIKYLLISLFALCGAREVYACWDPWYTPKGYYMYRVHSQQREPEMFIGENYPGSGRNCKDWQDKTSQNIPLEDIYKVVYKMSLEDFERVYDSRKTNGNKFLEWITQKDTTILDFLLLAKTNEYIRLKRNSRWFYPSMQIGARMTIEEVAEKALSVNVPKLRDRYLLQAVRALFSLGRYEECINLWSSEIRHLPEENLMRQLIQPYIAGAEYRVKRSERAVTYFAELGDVGSMLFCMGRQGEHLSTVDALEMVCEYAPNSRSIESTLQSFVRSLEPVGEYGWHEMPKNIIEMEKLYALCLKMAKGGRSNNPAMWYYTAAFLSDLRNNTADASYLIGLAEKSKKTPFIEESIKVFRIYIDAKTLPYDASYESKLFAQLKWLDSKIVNRITDDVRNEVIGGHKLFTCESFYYWNDMMRRILLAEVCPRMVRLGKTTRALQLANMADNRLLELVNKKKDSDWIYVDDNYVSISGVYTMSGYRYSEHFNYHDYSNHFFEMVDSLGVNTAIRYLQNVRKPASEFDRYLNARGYTGSDYLNDIVGTQCLRNMRYKDAVKYLGAVSKLYDNHLNVRMWYDPFSMEDNTIKTPSEFRYKFACKMHSLEQRISITADQNRKAWLIMEYATGLHSSFDRCWSLTQYYRGSNFWGEVCEKRDWENDRYTQAARDRVKKLYQEACDTATDDEVAAEINYALCRYKTVATKYPKTAKGQLVLGKCDNLRDHKTTTNSPQSSTWRY